MATTTPTSSAFGSVLSPSLQPRRGSSSTGADFQDLLAEQSYRLRSWLPLPGRPAAASRTAHELFSVVSSSSLAQLNLLLAQNLFALLKQANSAANLSGAPVGLPLAGPISQDYRDGHHAVDIAIPVGTPVPTRMAGNVVHAGWNDEGYGNLVIVENGAYRTYYAHLDSIPVREGDFVEAGTVVGLSGNTGNSTGPHLHYEVRVNGVAVPPELSGDLFG